MEYAEGRKKFNDCVEYILKDASREELTIIRQIIKFQLENKELDRAGAHKNQKRLR